MEERRREEVWATLSSFVGSGPSDKVCFHQQEEREHATRQKEAKEDAERQIEQQRRFQQDLQQRRDEETRRELDRQRQAMEKKELERERKLIQEEWKKLLRERDHLERERKLIEMEKEKLALQSRVINEKVQDTAQPTWREIPSGTPTSGTHSATGSPADDRTTDSGREGSPLKEQSLSKETSDVRRFQPSDEAG